jgi:heme/copper-type cytochrome/quinol oxidase subunit 3
VTGNQDLQNLERRTYRGFYSDGIIDIYIGISLLWIGVAWIWLPDIAGLAGVLPAIFITPMLTGRKRFLERRIGYVKWTEPRRQWEHRNLVAALITGTAFLLLGVGVYMFASDSAADRDILGNVAPGLIAWLLAAVAIGLAFLMSARRMLAYGGVLIAGGIWTAQANASPGWPLVAAGILVTITGIAMLTVFIRSNPVVDQQ